MKTVNLKSLIEIYDKNGSINIPEPYINYLGGDYKLEIKDEELAPLKSLIVSLEGIDPSLTLKDFNNFYIGYKIPQIGKEFDLLRITESKVLNLEYKREIESKDEIKKQLFRNKYYLKFLNREIILFTYIEKENALYKLDDNNDLIQTAYQELIEIIKDQGNDEKFEDGNLNKIFEPSNYLISPFTKTEEFINGEYFLTSQQENIEKDIIKKINSGGKFYVIRGGAGSGKTLLTYHIAKTYMNINHKVGIIHCAPLNDGHVRLRDEFGWNIKQIKYWSHLFINDSPSVVIVDEIQRIRSDQFNALVENVKSRGLVLIMCGDENQILKQGEGAIINDFIKNDYNNVIKFKLTTKIRTNEELANFIKVMLNLKRKNDLKISKTNNIDIVYFNDIDEAENYISTKEDFCYISYTPSQIKHNKYTHCLVRNPKKTGSTHKVIGQEFKNVIVVLSEHFRYDDKLLRAYPFDGNPYGSLNMFFQQITRAINKLEIVVVNNIDVFNELISIFKRDDI